MSQSLLRFIVASSAVATACLVSGVWANPPEQQGQGCCDPLNGNCYDVACDEPCTEGSAGCGNTCRGGQACIFPDETCDYWDATCCELFLGVPCGEGTGCYSDIQACCHLDNTCEDMPGGCCQAVGSTPLGAGSACNVNVQACCFGDGTCANMKEGCCQLAGGTPLGSGTACNPDIQACCFSDDDCLDIDPGCCEAQDGVPAGSGTACSDFGGWLCDVSWACCLEENPFCDNAKIHYCGTQLGGTPVPDWDCNDWVYYDPDGDRLIEPCDNCSLTPNAPWKGTCTQGDVGAECWANSECDITSGDGYCSMDQEDSEPSPPTTGDGVGDACDNCPATHNMGQEDGDDDDDGDVCDNCPDDWNPSQYDCDGDDVGDVCDTEPNCDGDQRADACDNDDDNDDVLDAVDVCDYTPDDAYDEVIRDVGHRLLGTIYGDVDGDCDRDQADLDAMPLTNPSCEDGVAHFEESCPECPACNSCCRGGQQY